jgi:phosphatidylglycerophosphate synthase
MHKQSYYIINGITIYRVAVTPILLFFIFTGNYDLFKWLLPVSFFTDLIDGFLARRYHVTSIMGTKLDSIGDDLTILAAVVGMFVFKLNFILDQILSIVPVLALFIIQIIFALTRYGKITSFHTYGAKLAALLQGVFLITAFLLPDPLLPLFYAATFVTIIELLEEIIMVVMLPEWKANVKGIYWLRKKDNKPTRSIT